MLNHRHPAQSATGEPFCTRSRMVPNMAGGVEIAWAHRWLRPDGALGAGGRPDSKLCFDGEILSVLQSGC